MKKILCILAAVFCLSFTGGKDAYVLYTVKGDRSDYQQLLAAASKADVVLFGELHDNAISHWLEAELAKDLIKMKKGKLIMGAEMFEADDQVVIDEYLRGLITEKTLKEEAKLWPNYKTDYRPLMELAKENRLPMIGCNVPRRYANVVYNKGTAALDSIDAAAKKWIAPLPLVYDSTLQCYKDIYASAGGHGGQNLPKSQALKDATMAYFIMNNLKSGSTFLHFNGAYHSNNHQGIEWYLKKQKPSLKVLTISTVEQEGIDTLAKDEAGIADFIICTPASMTKTQ